MKNEQRPGTTLVTSWKTMPSRRRRETTHRIPGGAKNEATEDTCYLFVKDEKERKKAGGGGRGEHTLMLLRQHHRNQSEVIRLSAVLEIARS